MAQGQMTPQQAALAAYQNNMQIRNAIVHGIPGVVPPSVDMWQPLILALPAAVVPGTQINIPLRNVGLVKRVVVEIVATITAGASAQTLTPLGLANLISNFLFFDLANNTRINTNGAHLHALASAKRRRVFGSAATTDTPTGYGNNYGCIKAASSIAGAGNTVIRMFYEVPFVRNDRDLRGLIFGDTTQATMQLQCTFSPQMFAASTDDPTFAVYQSAGADKATLSAVTVTAYQNYLDQGPVDTMGRPLAPPMDIGTAYVLTQSSSGLPVVNQLNAVNFINQRSFMSLFAIYDNAGALNAGTDITTFQLTSANFTQIRNLDPFIQSLMGRLLVGDDFPKGSYWFDFSERPIDTVQYGNMQFIVQPSLVSGATAAFQLFYEAYGTIGLINIGGSIPSGGF